MRAEKTLSLVRKILYNVLGWGIVLLVSFPLFWMISTAFKPAAEAFTFPPTFLPAHPTLENFERILLGTEFTTFFINSLLVASTTTVLVIVVALLGAYSLGRFRYAGRHIAGQMVLFTYLLPTVVLLLPLYVIIVTLGLVDSLWGLVIAYTTFAMPFALWLLRAFVASMPVDIEEAARVDGASRMQAFLDVVVPQALPGIISTALFTFILSWNEYLYALVFINTEAKKTLPPGIISLLTGTYNIEWELLMAASVMTTVPIVTLFSFLQRHLTKGFGMGTVKG